MAALIALPSIVYVVLEIRATFFTECPPPLDVVPWALAVSIIVLLACVAAIALVAGAITGRKPAQRSTNFVGGWTLATAAALYPAAIAFVWIVSLRDTGCLNTIG